MTDPISDFLTRIRNAVKAKHRVVEIPASNLKKAITEILYKQGYIISYKFDDNVNAQGSIKIALKYDSTSGISAIKNLRRISKPGLRNYSGATELPRVINGLGTAIISTSKGVMTEKEARKNNVGGEVLCYIS
jgi:small subunit ribosomal protein S8